MEWKITISRKSAMRQAKGGPELWTMCSFFLAHPKTVCCNCICGSLYLFLMPFT